MAHYTAIDWIILAIPALMILYGVRRGALAVLLAGPVRFLIAVPLAQIPTATLAIAYRDTFQSWAHSLGVPPLAIAFVIGVAFVAILMGALGIVHDFLAHVIQGSPSARRIDRLIGIPAGLVIGLLISAVFVVLPAVQMQKFQSDPGRQARSVRESVLVPAFERRLQPLFERLYDATLRSLG